MLGFISTQPAAKPEEKVIVGDRETVAFKHLNIRAVDPDKNVFYSATDSGEYSLGAAFVGAPLLGADESTVEKLRSALGMPLPAGSFVQIGLLSMPDVSPILNAYAKNKKKDGKSFLSRFSRERLDFLANGVSEPLVARSGVLMNTQKLIVTIKMPSKAMPDDIAVREAQEYADRIQESLKSAGVHLSIMTVEDYLAVMRRIFHPDEAEDRHYDDLAPIREQVMYAGDSICYERDQVVFNDGKYFARLMSVKHFPKRSSLAAMNHMIGDPGGISNQITDPFYMVMTLHYPDQVSKASEVRRGFAWINHQVFGPTAHLIPILGYKKAGFDTMIHEMEGRGAVLCEANLTLVLFSRDEKRLRKLTAGLQAYYTSLAFEMREDKRVLKALFNSVLPLNTTRVGVKNLYRFHSLAISHAVQFLPILGDWGGTGGGGASIFVTRRGAPALVDFFDSSTGFNFTMFAETGAGKSFLTNRFVCDYLAEGAKIWVLDAGRSYQKTCAAVGGQFIEFADESNICLNPFTKVKEIDDDMDIIKSILAKMAAPEDGLDDYRLAVLEEAIKSVWQHYGNSASVSAVAEWCLSQQDMRIRDIGKQLFPFTRNGSHGRWFEGENNVDFAKDFVLMEIQELASKKTLQQVVMLQLMSNIADEMFAANQVNAGRKKILLIDEGWAQLDDPVVAKALEAFYRKVRKAKGCVGVITQSVGDFYGSSNGTAIYENSAWQIILAQKSEAIDSAIRSGKFSMGGYGASQMKGIHTVPGKYSEFMVKRSDSNWGIVRLVEDRFAQVLFSTKDAERDDILAALQRGEDVIDTINNFIEAENLA